MSSLAFDPSTVQSSVHAARAQGAAAKSGAQSREALEAAARQFESVFLGQLMKGMRDANAAFQGETSNELQTVTGMFDQQLSQSLAESGGIGLADLIIRQVTAAQDYLKPAVSNAEGVSSAPPAS